MDVMRLEKAPKIAVYVPPNFNPWDDAVTLALDYAKISYDKIWNDEVLQRRSYQNMTGFICIMKISQVSMVNSIQVSVMPSGI